MPYKKKRLLWEKDGGIMWLVERRGAVILARGMWGGGEGCGCVRG